MIVDDTTAATRGRVYIRLVIRQRPVVEIWRVLDVPRRAIGIELNVEHPLGDDATLTVAGVRSLLTRPCP
jgi:hypothetical protein